MTHVDYSARIQTVHSETNPRYHALIDAFKALTGCPVIVNTSFNVRGEPIVCTPEDAFRCFMGTDIERAGGGQLLPAQGGAGPEPQARLQGRVRAGLSQKYPVLSKPQASPVGRTGKPPGRHEHVDPAGA